MNIRNFYQLIFGILTFIPGVYNLRAKKLGSGGSYSARYCYSVWMRHIISMTDKNSQFLNKKIVEIGPGDTLGVGLMGLLLGAKKYYAFDTVQFANVEKNLKIFNELVSLIQNKTKIPDNNEFPRMQPLINKYDFPENIYTDDFIKSCLHNDKIIKIRDSIINQNKKNSIIHYITPNKPKTFDIEKEIDLIISQATLEHVDDLLSMYKNFKKWISPNGIMSHSIDFKSHGYARSWDGHWSISNFRWFLMRGKRPYFINRKPLSTHLFFHSKYNFKIINKILINKDPILKDNEYNKSINLNQLDKKTSGAFIQSKLN